MDLIVRENERSYAIELISLIKQLTNRFSLHIKNAGGESTVSSNKTHLFPDLLLYGDNEKTIILQGWEVKLPDTPITNQEFIENACKKANTLGLNSFFLWNFSAGALYIKDNQQTFKLAKQWNDTSHIQSRDDVNTFRHDWETLIELVLIELNSFFIDGRLKTSSLGDVITDTIVVTLIERNKAITANELRQQSLKDSRINAFLETWWNDTKSDFISDEPDKFNAYAKVILLNWCNKFLFAHLIKRFHNKASLVDQINISSTPEQANTVFFQISKHCDFFNIFASLDHNHFLNFETWKDITDFNLFLFENGVIDLKVSDLQNILESTVSTSKKELAGQFTTPILLAKILVNLTIHDWRKDSIDPCCGTGSIIKEVFDKKNTSFGVNNSVNTSWASDKYSYPLQIANLSLTSENTFNHALRIFKHNCLDLTQDETISIINPMDGSALSLKIPRFSSVVSNLPFVPFDLLKGEDLVLVNSIAKEVFINTGIQLSGKSDLYCYLIFACHKILEDRGRVGVITSNAWLGTKWGQDFFRALEHYYEVNQLHISGSKKWFNNADVVTVILILTKKADYCLADSQSTTSFFKWNKSLIEVKKHPEYIESIINSGLLDKEINPNVIEQTKYKKHEVSKLSHFNISLNALFYNISWLLELEDKLVPISQVFDVFRGERRGWDQMFYPRAEHGIEKACLARVLKSSRNVTTLIAQPDSDAFCCSMTKNELRINNLYGALRWIERFEKSVNTVGRPLPQVLQKANMFWYEMNKNSSADFCTSMNPGERLFFARFNEATFINQRLIGLRKKQEYMDLDLYHALLNSIIGMFFIEATGFGRGLGALDINKENLSNTFILNPSLISNKSRTKILSTFNKLLERDILPTCIELEKTDRKKFDEAVLSALSINHLYDEIKQSLLSMQNSRLSVR